jgi:hypothetical protein
VIVDHPLLCVVQTIVAAGTVLVVSKVRSEKHVMRECAKLAGKRKTQDTEAFISCPESLPSLRSLCAMHYPTSTLTPGSRRRRRAEAGKRRPRPKSQRWWAIHWTISLVRPTLRAKAVPPSHPTPTTRLPAPVRRNLPLALQVALMPTSAAAEFDIACLPLKLRVFETHGFRQFCSLEYGIRFRAR